MPAGTEAASLSEWPLSPALRIQVPDAPAAGDCRRLAWALVTAGSCSGQTRRACRLAGMQLLAGPGPFHGGPGSRPQLNLGLWSEAPYVVGVVIMIVDCLKEVKSKLPHPMQASP
jgi:hypothetical protein